MMRIHSGGASRARRSASVTASWTSRATCRSGGNCKPSVTASWTSRATCRSRGNCKPLGLARCASHAARARRIAACFARRTNKGGQLSHPMPAPPHVISRSAIRRRHVISCSAIQASYGACHGVTARVATFWPPEQFTHTLLPALGAKEPRAQERQSVGAALR